MALLSGEFLRASTLLHHVQKASSIGRLCFLRSACRSSGERDANSRSSMNSFSQNSKPSFALLPCACSLFGALPGIASRNFLRTCAQQPQRVPLVTLLYPAYPSVTKYLCSSGTSAFTSIIPGLFSHFPQFSAPARSQSLHSSVPSSQPRQA